MNIEQTVRTLMGLPPRKSVLIEGTHGTGKSQVVAQTAAAMSKKLGKPFGFVDIRLGQYEVGDLIGLPEKQPTFKVTKKVYDKGNLVEIIETAENVTVHDLPLWFPRDKDSHGYLFFDELNRGSRDTQQWAFQVVLDYRVNFHDVPDGWRVIAACNDDQDSYNIINLDPALYDRFLVIKFRPLVQEWMDHAETINVHDAVLKYVKKHTKDLDPPEKIQTGVRYPSRRSWVALSDAIKHMKETGDDVLKDLDYLAHLAIGYLGQTVGVNFENFIKKDYKVFSAEEILTNFKKFKQDFEKMVATDYSYYNTEIIDYIKSKKSKLTKAQGENLTQYVKTVPPEVRAGFWTQFLENCKETATAWFTSDTELASLLRNSYLRK